MVNTLELGRKNVQLMLDIQMIYALLANSNIKEALKRKKTIVVVYFR